MGLGVGGWGLGARLWEGKGMECFGGGRVGAGG